MSSTPDLYTPLRPGANGRRAACALLPLLLAALPTAAPAVETLRVRVAGGLERVEIRGEGLAVRRAGVGGTGRAVGRGRVVAELRGGTLRVDGERTAGPAATVSGQGPLRLGGRVLTPEVEIRAGRRGLDVIEILPLEDYVAGVVAGEMPPDFPEEAQRAQAVAARTFALVRKIEAQARGRAWDLGAGVLSQVYAGAAPGAPARAAAEATAGEVLTRGNEPVEAYFHSACGGRTERGADALGRDLDYLAPVECGRCEGAPRLRWSVAVEAGELGRVAGLREAAAAARVAERTGTGRAARLEIAGGGRHVLLAAVDLRQRLGWSRLPSLAFDVREAGGRFVFEGRGAGHGAGLCQWGAAGMAGEGRTHVEILLHYYPGTEIRRMY
ncbi:MAG TPA: SpoIID/LytB domain-containing protein [Anaeromyxobacteraceae bacterium]|nr:SpoIID/LytB domain-containing protein [Anaeromyxobacteraceae bacterium]